MVFKDWIKSLEERFERGINRDESVIFYPSYGFKDLDGHWKIEVRGIIFEERELLKHIPGLALTLAGVPSAGILDRLLDESTDDIDAVQYFKERSKAFLVDGERNEQFEINLAGQIEKIGKSDSLGYFENLVTLPDGLVNRLFQQGDSPWVSFVAADNDKERFFTGKSQILPSTGITVVSDVDDTIKDSNVPEPVQLIINTLFRPFKVVAGMADIYQNWHKAGASIIYLTNSPYQLYEQLNQFLQKSYPEGAYYLRRIDWTSVEQSIDKLIATDEEVGTKENPKKYNLIPILERFPDRKFILVGDSTEKDAEIYTDLYLGEDFPDKFEPKAYSDRIVKIYIRDVPNSKRRTEAEAALNKIRPPQGEDIAMLFHNPEEILEDARRVFQNP